jgi:hypothetical protein
VNQEKLQCTAVTLKKQKCKGCSKSLTTLAKLNSNTTGNICHLSILLATRTPMNNRFSLHTQGIIKMVWYGYVCFKQCTVNEFHVTEKQIMSIHKQLNNVYGVRAVDRSSVKCWPS